MLERNGAQDFVLMLAFTLISKAKLYSTSKSFTAAYRKWLLQQRKSVDLSFTVVEGLPVQCADSDGYQRFSPQVLWLKTIGVLSKSENNTLIVEPAELQRRYEYNADINSTSGVTVTVHLDPIYQVDGKVVSMSVAKKLEEIVPGLVKLAGYYVNGIDMSSNPDIVALMSTIVTTDITELCLRKIK